MAVSALVADMSARSRLGFLGVLAVLGAAYLLLGQRAAVSRDRLQSHVYRLILVACCGLAAALFPQAQFLLFIAFPQIWFLSERIREGAIFSVLIVLANTAGVLTATEWSWAELGELAPWLVISLTMGLLLGIWIERVIGQSEQRADLITELDSDPRRAGRGQPRGRRDGRAGADGARDPRHPGAGHDQHRDARPGRPGRAGARRVRRTSARANWRRSRTPRGRTWPRPARWSPPSRPVALTGSPLPEVLRRQAERFSAETGIDVSVELDLPAAESAALSPGQQVVLLRSAQEALANVRKHAAASRVQIRLTGSGGGTAIEIRDDGQGFETAAPSTGFGLAAMRGRVEEVRRHRRGRQLPRPRHPGARAGAGGAGMIRVLVVDDHPVVRSGLVGLLGVGR